MCERLFNDKRVITVLILAWSVVSALTFYLIMAFDNSPFLNFGPSDRTELFGVKLDTWSVWWAVAMYTFISTGIGAYSSDSIIPWITNTIQDHKTSFIPYSKFTCLMIIQVFTFYGITQSIIGLFVALTQVDFMLIRLLADIVVNHFTTQWFLRHKTVDPEQYYEWVRKNQSVEKQDSWDLADLDIENELELGNISGDELVECGNTETCARENRTRGKRNQKKKKQQEVVQLLIPKPDTIQHDDQL